MTPLRQTYQAPSTIAPAALPVGLTQEVPPMGTTPTNTPTPPSSLTIRRAAAHDEGAFLALRNLQEAAGWSGGSISAEAHHAWFLAALMSPDFCLLVLVDQQDRVWGYARFQTMRTARVSVAVDPVVQGQGHGLRLLGALEDAARTRGVHALEALIHPENTRSVATFLRDGYRAEPAGEFRRFLKPL